VVALKSPVDGKPYFFILPGHNFGLLSAVVNFNRISRFFVEAARSLGAVTVDGYYDDFTVDEPSDLACSGSHWLSNMLDVFGMSFALAKHVPHGECNDFIGVRTDYSAMPMHGIVRLAIKESRRQKLIVELANIISRKFFTKADAQRLHGKLMFALSAHFGKMGKAILPIISKYGSDAYLGPRWCEELHEGLAFIKDLLPELRPYEIPACPVSVKPVLIYTDAMYNEQSSSRPEQAAVGFFVWVPHLMRWFHSWADVSSLCDQFQPAGTHIGRLEAYGVLVAIASLPPAALAGRPFISFIDNDGVLHNCVKGSSHDRDTTRIVHSITKKCAQLAAPQWFERCPSKANPADYPSRTPFYRAAAVECQRIVREVRSTWLEPVLPRHHKHQSL
jgi:hypothetical protein